MAVQAVQVLAPAVRQGTLISASVTIPAAVSWINVIANVLLADKLADGLTFAVDIQRSVDGVTGWQTVAGFGWTSYGPAGYPASPKGTYPANPDPAVAFNPSVYVGQHFRLVAEVPQPLSLGLTVEITT